MAKHPFLVRTFRVDVTPPVGDYLCGGLHDRSTGVEAPLDLRGVIVSSPLGDFVVAAIDFCYLCGRSYQRLVDALAEGARVSAGQITVHANHLHDAPLVDEEAHALIAQYLPDLVIHNEAWFADLLDRVRATLRQTLKAEGTPIGAVGFARHPVEQFASSRRVIGGDGKCRIRWSVCQDAAVRDAPEGTIDPMLKTVVLYGLDQQPVTCMSFYASHPQVSDGRRLVSTDTVGIARERFGAAYPGVFSIPFDGCGGDVTAGKYSTADRLANRQVFGTRLFDALNEAFNKSWPRSLSSIEWNDETDDIPLAPVRQDERELLRTLREDDWRSNKYMAATKLLRMDRRTYPFRTTRLTLGDVDLLFLPAEMCVEYQLYAQQKHSGALAVAAYGDCFLKYVATDEAFDQGGYEVDPKWTEIGKGIEGILKGRIDAILPGTC